MKNQNKLILAALVVFPVVVIACWLLRKSPSPPPAARNSAGRPTAATPALREVQPVPQQSEAAPAAKVATAQKKYSQLGVLERNAILTEIGKQDLPAIFRAMLDAERLEHDSMKQLHLQTTFADAFLNKQPSPEFLEHLYGFLINSSTSKSERDLLLGALRYASTKETVDLLLRVANTAPEQKIREAASGLAGVGAQGRGGSQLSPALERVWRDTKNPDLLRSTAVSMARIGTPSGIELLLSAALTPDSKDQTRQIAAQDALLQVDKPEAAPPLAARLANQPPASEVVQLVAPILVRNPAPAAQEALVGWLRSRPENAAPLVDHLIRQRIIVDPFQSAWATALDPAVPFRNEENRQAIRAALAAYRAGRTLEP
jgi:hypothetical protein